LGIWLRGNDHTEEAGGDRPGSAGGGRVSGPFRAGRGARAGASDHPAELQIFGLIADGLSNKEIAERVFVSENTVKTHAAGCSTSLSARGRRTEAVQIGKSSGSIP